MKGCRPLSDSEIQAITKELSIRDRCLFTLGLRTGLRISELLSLNVSAVQDTSLSIRRAVTVAKRATKGKVEGKTLPLHPEAIEAIAAYLKECPAGQSEPLFRSKRRRGIFGRLEKSVFHKALKNACSRARIRDEQLVASHSMRKTFAAKFYEACGQNILLTQKALCHKSLNSTVSYIGVDDSKVSELIRGLK
jgi:integrase